MVNSFLQFLERDDSDSLIIAATNFVGMLDEALIRRFDEVTRCEIPDGAAVRAVIENRLVPFQLVGVRRKSVTSAAEGLSHAEVIRACEESARPAALSATSEITGVVLADMLRLSLDHCPGSGQNDSNCNSQDFKSAERKIDHGQPHHRGPYRRRRSRRLDSSLGGTWAET
ncbi:MAG: hypothetical protein NT069_28165 [Planctomycetota bacterium]|nr:hypothetical protein [Planctomycetota bacterium]